MANERSRQPRGQGGPTSDIERFLMEVERLRRKTAEDKRRVDTADTVDDVEVVRPAPRPAPPPPPRPVIRPRPRPAVVRPAVPVLEVEPARPSQSQPAGNAIAPLAPSLSLPPEVVATRTGQPVSLAIQQVVAMLRAKDQVRAAILISEILSPPLSHRRGRR
jgi:hypothetical protein